MDVGATAAGLGCLGKRSFNFIYQVTQSLIWLCPRAIPGDDNQLFQEAFERLSLFLGNGDSLWFVRGDWYCRHCFLLYRFGSCFGPPNRRRRWFVSVSSENLFGLHETIPTISPSRIRTSWPSSKSVYLPNMMTSPGLTASARRSPYSLRLPGPQRTTSPRLDSMTADSGRTMLPLCGSSSRRTRILSSSGWNSPVMG